MDLIYPEERSELSDRFFLMFYRPEFAFKILHGLL